MSQVCWSACCTVKSLGIIFDECLTFDAHVSAVCKGCFFHIRALRHICPSISTETVKLIACAIDSSKLDNCNSVFAGMSEANFNKLERGRYALACMVTGMPAYFRDQMTPVLAKLHWLPIQAWVPFKIAMMVFKIRQQSSHPTWQTWSKMLFHPGPCNHLHVVKACLESKQLLSLVLELSATLQPKCRTFCQTMSG